MTAVMDIALRIRPETPSDVFAIGVVVDAAFRHMPMSDHSEGVLIERLRRDGALSLSLVALIDEAIVGHIAFSHVMIDRQAGQWFGLGPLAVEPRFQRRHIGSALVNAGLDWLVTQAAAGCVVLGEPQYYGRFGFQHDPALTYCGQRHRYFQSRLLAGPAARGDVSYNSAFSSV